MTTTTLRIGSLFTGTGALDMAAQAVVGGEVVWYSDIKPAAVRLLEHRYPGTPNLGDLTELFPVDVTSEHLAHLDDLDPARWLPVTADVDPIDLLTFGWPCQPHSSAGKRLGEADPRALLRNVLRAVGHLRPRILLGENVARVASNGELRRAVRALAALGYVGTWRCAPASDEGAPHKRDRVALVAVRADAVADLHGERLTGWAERDGATVEPGERTPRGVDADGRGARGPDRLTLLPTPTQNMTTGPGRQGRAGGMNLQTAAVALFPTPCASDTKGPNPLTRPPGDDDLPTRVLRLDPRLLPTPKASDGLKGGPGMRGSSGDLAMPSAVVQMDGRRWGVYAEAVHRWEQALGRSAPDPTMPSSAWSAMIAKRRAGLDRRPVGMRGSLAPRPQLSPWFVEWMMGLPAGWVCDVPDLAPKPSGWRNAALSLLGDGVVPQQLAAGFRAGLVELAARLEVAA